jgi:hypothetical protein
MKRETIQERVDARIICQLNGPYNRVQGISEKNLKRFIGGRKPLKRAISVVGAILLAFAFVGGDTDAQHKVPVNAPTATTKRVWVDHKKFINGGHFAYFINRDKMKAKVGRDFKIPKAIPATTLPVDCTGSQTVVAPMDGNDTYGDCGPAMCCHVDNILTFGQGKSGWTQSTFDQNAIIQQYLAISGGDNGTDESMLVGQGGLWVTGNGIAGASGSWPASAPNANPLVVDSLDIDVTNVPLAQYAIDQFYTIQMAWSVPDSFINSFAGGQTYDAPVTPDPENGHYTPLTDIATNGNYTLYTWGTFCFVTPAFVAQVQPQCFVVFSTRQFNPATGFDSHGRHITTQAVAWVSAGGKQIPASVISAFPPPSGPTPPSPVPPGPTPPIPTPTPTPGASITVTLSGSPPDGTYTLQPTPPAGSKTISMSGFGAGVDGQYVVQGSGKRALGPPAVSVEKSGPGTVVDAMTPRLDRLEAAQDRILNAILDLQKKIGVK